VLSCFIAARLLDVLVYTRDSTTATPRQFVLVIMRASLKTVCIILGFTALGSSAVSSLQPRKIVCANAEDDPDYAPVSHFAGAFFFYLPLQP